MAEENNKNMAEAPEEQKTRSTPKTGAEQKAETRDRTSELPSDVPQNNKLEEMRENADNTANQTIDEGVEEVQGKLAVPKVKVMKRGSTKFTDENGNVVKTLNNAEVNAPIAEEEKEDYLLLHEAVLNGEDPIKATLKFQARKPEEGFAEGKLANAEEHPRTSGLGAASGTENEQK